MGSRVKNFLYNHKSPEAVIRSKLKKVCEYFGCDIGSSVAAGDEENDLEMIKAAGIGCAVANAVPSVKAAAAFVTHNDCEHDGIIEIIDRFVIG